jgi:beta-galactosidase
MEILSKKCFLILLAALCPTGIQAERAKFNFNPDWRLHVGDVEGAQGPGFDDSEWKPVTLPRAWNEDDAFRRSIEKLPTDIAWYRKSFVLPPASAGKKVFVEFEGIRQGAEFFINGTSLGFHEDGVTAVGFDLTPHVLPEPATNVLSVRTDNAWDYREQGTKQRYQWNDRNFNANYGGIPRNVRLHVTEPVYQTLPLYHNLGTTGVYIYAADFDLPAGSAGIHAESEVKNDSDQALTVEYHVSVAEPGGKELASFQAGSPITLAPGGTSSIRASQRVSGLKWWSWGHGALYDVTTRLVANGKVIDSVRTRTGFRQTHFGEGMITLNGRVIQMKGYAQRTTNEWPAVGVNLPPWLSDFSNGLMVESGANLVRWMHTAPSKQDVESCDRVGLMQAMPAGDSESDVTGRRWEQRVEVMRASIIYNRNNPSIIFYEGGNNGISEEHMAELNALRDRYDPHGGRASGSRNMLGSKLAEYGGEMLYINKSARIPFWATEYSRDEGLRKYWDEFSPPFHKDGDGPPYKGQSAAEYNRNQDSHAIENIVRWFDYWEARPGTGKRVSSGGTNIIFSDTNTHYRGAENYRRSGEVDAMRIPKDGFYAHQVMWDGWVDVENPRAHIFGHWNYAPGTRKPVHVVSSAREVELFVNGKSQGRNRSPQHQFLFSFPGIEWQAGLIEAIGYDSEGKEICRAKHETTGKPTKLRLSSRVAPDGIGFKADGADLALLEIEVTDAEGRRVPTALDLVEFSIDGPAEWRGGIAQGPDNHILSKILPVECGVNRALIRSITTAGVIRVRATAPGLAAAELELASVAPASTVSQGVQPRLPDAGLSPSFVRGPTPQGASFTPSRISVPVASATAGGNQGDAALAYDDDETTTWTNGRENGSAWIEFTLTRPARLTEITAKLPRWRSRTYPLSVSIDGKEVFRGTTPTSLGYVTLPLKPALGRVVRVQLVGKGDVVDGFGAITELADQGNAADGPPVARGELGIVEIEFHEAVR